MIPTPTSSPAPSIETQKTEPAALTAQFASRGPNSTAYATVLDQLGSFRAADSRLAYVYILQQQDGTVRFIMVSGYDLPNSEIFGAEYQDAPEELKSPVTEPIAIGPYTDPFGTFISGLAPLDMETDKTIYLVGVDMSV